MKMMMKFGILPKIPTGIVSPSLSSIGQGILPPSLQSGMSMTSEPSSQNTSQNILQLATKLVDQASHGLAGDSASQTAGSILQLATKLVDQASHDLAGDLTSKAGSASEAFTSKSTPPKTSFSSRTEKVVTNFLQDLTSVEGGNEVNELLCNRHRY